MRPTSSLLDEKTSFLSLSLRGGGFSEKCPLLLARGGREKLFSIRENCRGKKKSRNSDLSSEGKEKNTCLLRDGERKKDRFFFLLQEREKKGESPSSLEKGKGQG